MTTKQELKGDWKTVAGNVKEKFGQITDDELRQVEGNAEQLACQLVPIVSPSQLGETVGCAKRLSC